MSLKKVDFDITPDKIKVSNQVICKNEPKAQVPENVEQFGPYYIQDHATYSITQRQGIQKLSNCEIRISKEIVKDDGQEQSRLFLMTGITEEGTVLPEIRVPVPEYGSMNWVSKWGHLAVIAANNAKDKLREAILLRSRRIDINWIYSHTGWLKTPNGWVFLFHGGAIGAEGISVELEAELKRYVLVPSKDLSETEEAIRLSLSFLDIAPLSITAPLWALIWAAPFSSFTSPDFTAFLVGTTGSLKSSMVAMLLAHFGNFKTKLDLLGSWASTGNFLEKMAFLTKDVLFPIDDYAPGATAQDETKLDRTAAQLFRSAGNKTGRGRMKANTELRAPMYPRGMLIATGEMIPGGTGESTSARVFAIETTKDAIDLIKLSRIQENAHLLSKAMAAFIEYVRPNLDERILKIKSEWELLARKNIGSGHLRVPEAAAHLQIGIRLGLEMAQAVNVLNQEQHDEWLAKCDSVIIDLAARQAERIVDDRPTIKYLRMVHELINSHQICLRNCGCTDDFGWFDNDHYFLMPRPVMTKVKAYSFRAGEQFTLSPKALHKQLFEDGYSEKDESGNRYMVKATKPRTATSWWVLKLKRNKVDEVSRWVEKLRNDHSSKTQDEGWE